MTTALGFGLTPLGIGPYGIGTPAATAPLGGAPLTGIDGSRQSVRKIDLATRRYVYDATGRAQGDSAVHQQMQMIATTDLGSSAVALLGNTMRTVKDVTPSVVQRIKAIWTTAYADMVDRGLVSLGDITVEVQPATRERGARALTRIPYMDLTTGKPAEITL